METNHSLCANCKIQPRARGKLCDACRVHKNRNGVDRPENLFKKKCICGFSIVDTGGIIEHKKTCEQLRFAVRDDIQRISKMLGHRCRAKDYKAHGDKNLPSYSWLEKYWGSWRFVASGMTEDEYITSIIEAAIEEVRRIGLDLTGSTTHAPTMRQYEKYKQSSAPGHPIILKDALAVPATPDEWARFVGDYAGLMVLGHEDIVKIRLESRAQNSDCETGELVEFLNERDLATITPGLPVLKASSVPLPNGNYEVTYVLQ